MCLDIGELGLEFGLGPVGKSRSPMSCQVHLDILRGEGVLDAPVFL